MKLQVANGLFHARANRTGLGVVCLRRGEECRNHAIVVLTSGGRREKLKWMMGILIPKMIGP